MDTSETPDMIEYGCDDCGMAVDFFPGYTMDHRGYSKHGFEYGDS